VVHLLPVWSAVVQHGPSEAKALERPQLQEERTPREAGVRPRPETRVAQAAIGGGKYGRTPADLGRLPVGDGRGVRDEPRVDGVAVAAGEHHPTEQPQQVGLQVA